MICVSIGYCNVDECIELLKRVEFAEIRMDSMNLSENDIEKIFSQPKKLIATCRPLRKKDEDRLKMLEKAIDSGAAYVDFEVESKEEFKKQIVKKAKEKSCKIIVSYHNYDKTPKKAELEHLVNWCRDSGADIVKIACAVNSKQENARLLGLLDSERELVVIGMGKKGRITRQVATILGAPFTYASLSEDKKLAPGQIEKENLEKIIKVLWDG